MQLRLASAVLLSAAVTCWVSGARADDRVDATTTWFQEKREGGLGGLTVIHPQLDFGVDVGESTSLGFGYAADIVSGATAKVYSVDAVSSATTFSDTRHEGSVSLGFGGSRSRLSFHGGIGTESDYHSFTAGASGDIDLPGKNTNIALSYTHNFDEVCDRDNSNETPFERRTLDDSGTCKTKSALFGEDTVGVTMWHDITIDTAQGTITQNLSPTLIAQVSTFGQIVQGFQSNPYRAVRVRGIEAQEAVPAVRARLAVTGRLNKYLPALRSAVNLTARGYSDTWGVNSGTFELAYSQYVGNALLLRFRGRVYQQSSATFFKDAFFYMTEGEAGAYFTGDRELGKLRHVMTGAKLSYIKVGEQGENVWGLFDQVRLNLKADILFLTELAADDLGANPSGIDGQFLSSGQFLDGFTLQLGLLLAY